MKQIVTIMIVLLAITAFASRKDIINELSTNIGIPTPSYTKAMDGLSPKNCVIQYRQSVDNSRTLNRLVLFHLVFADFQLSSSDLTIQKNGFEIAYESANEASGILKNNNLAFGIVQSFLVPNIKLAPKEAWQYKSTEDMLLFYANLSANIENYPALEEAYRIIISTTSSTNTADATRIRLISALKYDRKYIEALKVYDEISDDNIKLNLANLHAELLKLAN